jgi:hypothetical protein
MQRSVVVVAICSNRVYLPVVLKSDILRSVGLYVHILNIQSDFLMTLMGRSNTRCQQKFRVSNQIKVSKISARWFKRT